MQRPPAVFDPIVTALVALVAAPFCGYVVWRAWTAWQRSRQTGAPLDPEEAWAVMLPGVFLFAAGALPLVRTSGPASLLDALVGVGAVVTGYDINSGTPGDPLLLLLGRIGLAVFVSGIGLAVVLHLRRRAWRRAQGSMSGTNR